MRLAVPAPVAHNAPTKCAITVQVPGEPSTNVSSVHIVPSDNSIIRNECDLGTVNTTNEAEGRSFASAECQTEEPTRRRRTPRRSRQPRPQPASATVPDIINVHVPPPPPYTTLPPGGAQLPLTASLSAPLPGALPAQPLHRFPFQPIPIRRSGRSAAYACADNVDTPKSCCGFSNGRPPLRWCVILVGVAGICCVAAGAVLGALRPHPRAHLTLLLLMIGVGVVLVSVAGLAWRISGRDTAPCGALLGLRTADSARRLVARLPPSYARPHHPYAAMLYPEFHYRPPPPSYQASMQEYRLRLLLLDRSAPIVSPPPTYRSNNASLVRGAAGIGWCGSEYSEPPSYRGRPPIPPIPPSPTDKSETPEVQDSLVTVVHTEPVSPLILTVSGSPALNERTQHQHVSEIDILAHL